MKALASLSSIQLETLLTVLQERQQALNSLEELCTHLSRIALLNNDQSFLDLRDCLFNWYNIGGNSQTLSLAIQALLTQRESLSDQKLELVWSGPDAGVGAVMRDQSLLISQLIEQVQHRLLITTFNFYKGPFIAKLFEQIASKMNQEPNLRVRFVCNIKRPKGNTSTSEQLLYHFRQQTWHKLWPKKIVEREPELYYDPRSLALASEAVFHVKTLVADQELLITSANLTDAAQRNNFELGLRLTQPQQADAVWIHFDQLIRSGLLVPVLTGAT